VFCTIIEEEDVLATKDPKTLLSMERAAVDGANCKGGNWADEEESSFRVYLSSSALDREIFPAFFGSY
jgi:hypothetical protein